MSSKKPKKTSVCALIINNNIIIVIIVRSRTVTRARFSLKSNRFFSHTEITRYPELPPNRVGLGLDRHTFGRGSKVSRVFFVLSLFRSSSNPFVRRCCTDPRVWLRSIPQKRLPRHGVHSDAKGVIRRVRNRRWKS